MLNRVGAQAETDIIKLRTKDERERGRVAGVLAIVLFGEPRVE